MRVVYFVSLFPAWSETFIVREVHELLRLGVDVRIVSLKAPQQSMVQSDARALLDRVIYPRSPGRALATLLRRPVQAARELVHICRKLGRHPEALAKSVVVWWRTLGLLGDVQALAPDHIHAHWATYPSTAALLVSRRLGIPFSFTAHAHDIFLEHHLLEDKMRHAAFGVTISEFNRRYLAQRVSPDATERMRVIHCGVSPREIEFKPAGRAPATLLAVGRFDEIKGFRYLIEACALLVARGLKFECRVIGDGPLREQLRRQIDEAGLGHCVHLLGARPQEEVRRELYRTSVFVLPSVVKANGDRDGIPVALMEAMACGAPVVSTRVSGIPELVEEGVSGLLVPPADAGRLAQALEQLLTRPALGAELARAAREKVESEFDVAKEARKLYEAFA
ncbi:glycosyltransferase [Caldimonas tepidiphila]|uniref:glycosyltransferase n=1 Tax=Caldimonas tepidiphila TaxID=2315841 RepID=UPI000E5B1E05|nr:glycosyltransferase [Caldimonas tepidiphila]